MSFTQYLLNAALLVLVLGTNLGRRVATPRRLLFPVALVAVAAVVLLRSVPTAGNDVQLELAGVAAGVAAGALAGTVMSVERVGARAWTVAGVTYAAIWVGAIGGRMLFAAAATGPFATDVGQYSMRHQITGADAWTTAFVLMALTMVLTRVAVTTLKLHRQGREDRSECGNEPTGSAASGPAAPLGS